MRSTLAYYMTALPSLTELEIDPPLSPADLLTHLKETKSARELVEVIFLHGDLLQREAVLAGELHHPSAAVLSQEQVRNEASLPEELGELPTTTARPVQADVLWERYFARVAEVAERHKSSFLKSWLGYEVGLRNALVSARAKALGLDEHDYLVADELGDTDQDYSNVVNEWASAGDPLAGMRVLLRARWGWLTTHDEWFQFSDDELAAYAAKLMLIHQYHRLAKAEETASAER